MFEKYIAQIAIAAALISSAAIAADPLLDDRIYDKSNKPNRAYFGDSLGGLMAESMELRQESERDLQRGDIDEAIRKARKALQFDSGNSASHLALARALSAKLYKTDFEGPSRLYDECLHEWHFLRWHPPEGFGDSGTDAGKELVKLRLARLGAGHRRKKREREVEAIVLGAKGQKTK